MQVFPKEETFILFYAVYDEDEERIRFENREEYIENDLTLEDALSDTVRRILSGLPSPTDYNVELGDFYDDYCTVTFYGDLDFKKSVEDELVDGEFSFSNLYTVTWKLKITGIERCEFDVKEPQDD